jgi:hypothetical protein
MADPNVSSSLSGRKAKPRKPSVADLAAIKARSVRAGKHPTRKTILATYNRNQAKTNSKGRATGTIAKPDDRTKPTTVKNTNTTSQTLPKPPTSGTKPGTTSKGFDTSFGRTRATGDFTTGTTSGKPTSPPNIHPPAPTAKTGTTSGAQPPKPPTGTTSGSRLGFSESKPRGKRSLPKPMSR